MLISLVRKPLLQQLFIVLKSLDVLHTQLLANSGDRSQLELQRAIFFPTVQGFDPSTTLGVKDIYEVENQLRSLQGEVEAIVKQREEKSGSSKQGEQKDTVLDPEVGKYPFFSFPLDSKRPF